MKRIVGLLLIVIGVAAIAAAALALWPGNEDSGDVAAVESALRPEEPTAVSLGPPDVTTTTLPPEETSDAEEPQETADIAAPIGLRIEELGVDAPVDPYGVDQRTGQMDVPDNVTDVGWYKFGPSPGAAGSAVLAAHVDLAGSGPGVFFALDSLEEGDGVVVLYEDGTESSFRVIARATYDKDELPLDVIFSREGPAVLTLVTCGGGFNRNLARYDSNVVVYAVPDLGGELPEGANL
ncbi:MAG: class F sortase [Acidimicrobiia bacterium]|nr:class F sortase [Acidimicrobiia bacterium]